jgi:hypothetical protein
MSYYLAETYTPTAAWIALTADEKADYFAKIGAGMGPLMEMGIEPLAFCASQPDVAYAGKDAFFAIWRCPDRAALDVLVAAIAETGWHAYFDTRNIAGFADDIGPHLGQLAGHSAG